MEHANSIENRIILSGCIILQDWKILLLYKTKHAHWELPGGKVEEGETIEQTAIREAKEEIGCDVKLIKHLFYEDFHIKGRDFRSHNFLAEIREGQIPSVMEKEPFSGILWMPISDYPNYPLAPNVKNICENYANGKVNLR